MNALPTVVFMIAMVCGSSSQNPGQASIELEKLALPETQRILAYKLDAELPGLSFAEWFEKVIGPGTRVIWQLSECGEVAESAPKATSDMRACVEVNSILPNGRKVIVMIRVGTFKKGMVGAPAFHFGVVQDKGELYPVRRLRDLQQQLLDPKKLVYRPIVKLPDVSTPKLGLRMNNAFVAGSPLLSLDELSQLTPIEAPPAAPPEPELASTNGTLTTEKPTASAGLVQGAPIFKPQPKYPPNARRFRASGQVEVRVTISVTGRVTKAVAISGHPLLREAAIEAALRWDFEPTMLNGVRIETELVLTFDFAVPPPP